MNNVKEIGIYEPLIECLTEQSRGLSEFYLRTVLGGTPQFYNMGLKPYEIVKEWQEHCKNNKLDIENEDNARIFLLDYMNKYNQKQKLKIISKMFGGNNGK